MVYSAADVFVMPSSQEAFGLTALEATACGTPVIGFAVGGLLDILRPGINGLLVPPKMCQPCGAPCVIYYKTLRDGRDGRQLPTHCCGRVYP